MMARSEPVKLGMTEAELHEQGIKTMIHIRNVVVKGAALALVGVFGGWVMSDRVNAPEHYKDGFNTGYDRGNKTGFEQAITSNVNIAVGKLACSLMETAHDQDPAIFEDFDFDACINQTAAASSQAPGTK